jgi:membrane protein DedA with SNARE-associated domain
MLDEVQLTRRRLSELLCGGGLIAGIVAAYAISVSTPELLKHHGVLLEALTAGATSIVTGGAFAHTGRDSLLLVIIAPLCTVLTYDAFYWWAGRLWGETVIARLTVHSPRWARWMQRSEAAIRRRGILVLFASYYLPVPTSAIDVACGLAEMPLWVFVIGDAVGLMFWDGLLIGLGWAIGHRAVHLVNVIDHYSLWITIGVIILTCVAVPLRRRRRPSGARSAPPDPR